MPTTPDDVARAITAARQGDSDALGLVWRAHQPLVLRYLRGRGAQDAADIASQVWIDAARNLHRFQGDAIDFRRWLFTIARRRLVDARRHAARHDAETVHTVVDKAAAPGADVVFDQRDALTRALTLVKRLPDPMRDAVLLRFVADLSVEDAAAVMGVRAGHVRVLTHRGLARLERLLADESTEPVTLPVPPTMKGPA